MCSRIYSTFAFQRFDVIIFKSWGKKNEYQSIQILSCTQGHEGQLEPPLAVRV